MQTMLEIRRIGKESQQEALSVIHAAFGTVAREFGLTKESSPTHGAFIGVADLARSVERGLMLYGYYKDGRILGCAGIRQGEEADEYSIEKLCVLPEQRHRGIGFDLLAFCENEVRDRDGKRISVGIIDANRRLKDWYLKNGYEVDRVLSYDHLPFDVCVLRKEL
jgi:GNAT superfamily N-acetyltransferase